MKKGIAGILASGIAEKYMKPCFVFHNDESKCVGSARTFGNFPIIECLNKSRDLIISGGGHNAACGLAIEPNKLSLFQESCNNVFNEWLNENPNGLIQELFSTCEIDNFDILTIKLVHSINKLKPFGEGNPEPIFITKNVDVGVYTLDFKAPFLPIADAYNTVFMGYNENSDLQFRSVKIFFDGRVEVRTTTPIKAGQYFECSVTYIEK